MGNTQETGLAAPSVQDGAALPLVERSGVHVHGGGERSGNSGCVLLPWEPARIEIQQFRHMVFEEPTAKERREAAQLERELAIANHAIRREFAFKEAAFQDEMRRG